MVRVRLMGEETTGKTVAEVLAKVKPAILAAIEVRPLRSGDVDMFVKDQTTRDFIIK
jgi:hypothetical protein